MLRLFSTIRKELLILIRDRSGLAIMFLMPICLVTIMALIQDAPFRDYQEMKIPLLLANSDTGNFGKTIEQGFIKSKLFFLTKSKETSITLKEKIAHGDFEIGIIIPKNASSLLNIRVDDFVSKTLVSAGLPIDNKKAAKQLNAALKIDVYFAPGTKKSFRNSVLSSIKQFSSKLETQVLLNTFTEKLKSGADRGMKPIQMTDFVNFDEKSATEEKIAKLEMNSVQHNVPAWTMFGMFFIVISLAGSIIKEREDGSYLRVRAMPGSYSTVMAGKICAYLSVCMIQCFLMLLAGIILMPILGLPKLLIGTSSIAILVVAVCSGLAATGYGILLGTIFNTHQQSATFGSISVVMLAALGGVWIPVDIMPASVRVFAEFSPLYWGLSAFNEIFLKYGTVRSILPEALKLITFAGVTLILSAIIDKLKNFKS